MPGIKLNGQQTKLKHPHQFYSVSYLSLLHLCVSFQICSTTTCNRTPTNSSTTCWTRWLTSCRRRRSRKSRTDASRTTVPPSPRRPRRRTRLSQHGFMISSKAPWPMRPAASTVKQYVWLCSHQYSLCPCVTLNKKSLLNKSEKGISLLQRCWEMLKRFSVRTRWAPATHFTSGLLTALSSQVWGRGVGRVALNNPCKHCTDTKATQFNKHFKDWLSVCVVLSQHSGLIVTDSVKADDSWVTSCLFLFDRWAAKMRIFWIFLWMWSRTHQ